MKNPDAHIDETGINLAKNPKTSVETLRGLAKSVYSTIRGEVAANKSCPSDVLETLSNDESAYVRYKVIENEGIDPVILGRFALDEVFGVRQMALENTRTPISVLLGILGTTKEESERENILQNLKGRDVLDELLDT